MRNPRARQAESEEPQVVDFLIRRPTWAAFADRHDSCLHDQQTVAKPAGPLSDEVGRGTGRGDVDVLQEWWRALSGRVIGSGFNLLALMILVLILGVFAAGATPGYFTYSKDAKSVEAKLLAGSLWRVVTLNALGTCGTAAEVTAGYPRTGLDSTGSTIPARWSVIAANGKTVTVDCSTGAITPDGDLFVITGTAVDVDSIRVKLNHRSATAPPWQLQCSTDAGSSFHDC